MARKRIKSLAKEWGVPLEDVIASCERLKLAHAHTEASLLGPDEADRIKADLDEQAHRNTILRKETVVETSAGTIVEKRLNATVMRRRHSETAPTAGGEAAQPFHFEAQETAQEETFASPFMNESPQVEAPVFEPVVEPAKPQAPVSTAPKSARLQPFRNLLSKLPLLKFTRRRITSKRRRCPPRSPRQRARLMALKSAPRPHHPRRSGKLRRQHLRQLARSKSHARKCRAS
jgi:hypothetical protein